MHDAIYYLIMAIAIVWALSKTFPKNAPPSKPVGPEDLEAAGEDWREHGNIQPAWPDGFEIRSQEDDPGIDRILPDNPGLSLAEAYANKGEDK